MPIGGFGILRIPEWMVKFAYLNFLWACFSFFGVIIFGVFPATTAMFAIIRKWLNGDLDIPIFKTFWAIYKKEFLKSNGLGLLLVMVGFTLYIDYQLLQQATDSLHWIYYLLIPITFLYVMTSLYAFPIFVHYDLSILQALKTSFIIMITSPLSTIMIIAGSIILYFFLTTFPGLIPICGASLLAFLIMWSTHFSLLRITEKKSRLA